MKKRKYLAAAAVTLMIALLFVSALTLTSCDNGNDPAESSTESVPADTLPPVPEDTGITVAKDKTTAGSIKFIRLSLPLVGNNRQRSLNNNISTRANQKPGRLNIILDRFFRKLSKGLS